MQRRQRGHEEGFRGDSGRILRSGAARGFAAASTEVFGETAFGVGAGRDATDRQDVCGVPADAGTSPGGSGSASAGLHQL